LQNFLVAVPAEAAGALGVTWSLAIEEQFYLVWPLVVRYFSAAQVKRIAVTVILASPLLRFFLAQHHVNIYSSFFCRLDGLMAGALLAVVLRSQTFLPPKYVKLAWMSFLIAACLAILAKNRQVRWIAFSMTSLASVSLVYLSLFSPGKRVQRFFRNRFLTYTGTISYGLYLLHKIPLDVSKEMHTDRHPFLSIFVVLVASYALAAISYAFLEQPFLKLKRFFDLRAGAHS
jgi:peptidoglycan/LPS O-acetylase OafA/YrhL